MGDFVQPEELASILQQDLDRATAELAISLVEAEVLELAQKAAADCPVWVRGIVLQAAIRLYDNPTAASSESVDDYQRRFQAAAQDGLLLETERARVAGINSPVGAFSVSPFATRTDPDTGEWLAGW